MAPSNESPVKVICAFEFKTNGDLRIDSDDVNPEISVN